MQILSRYLVVELCIITLVDGVKHFDFWSWQTRYDIMDIEHVHVKILSKCKIAMVGIFFEPFVISIAIFFEPLQIFPNTQFLNERT